MALESANTPVARPAVTVTAQTPQMKMNAPQQPPKWSFHNSSMFQRGPIGRNISSEALGKLQKAIEEIFKSSAPNFEIQLLSLDNNNQTNLAYSCLVVCLKNKAEPELGVAFYTFIIEGSGEKIPPRFENINGNQVEIIRTASEANDAILAQEIGKKLAAMYPNQRLLPSDACVIPASFKPEDIKAVHAIAVSAGMACHTLLLSKSPSFVDLRLSENQHDSNLVVQPRYENKTIEDAVGAPIRSDVQIAFSSQQNNQNQANKSVNDSGRVIRVSQIDGFVDLVWAPVVESNQFSMYQPNIDPRTVYQKYAARFVMTQVTNEYLQTLPAYLLSLVTATLIREQNNWYNVFRPRATLAKEVDLHDIGMVNLECALPGPDGQPTRGPIDTKTSTFGAADLARLISMCVRPGLILSMDIADAGPDTWCTSAFAAASDGSPEVRAGATKTILDAAQYLTNGNFGNHFPQGTPLFVDSGNRVHMGFYEDSTGAQRDIRNLDYLAVLTQTQNDPEVIKKYSDTFTNNNIPLNLRLAERKRIYAGIVNRLEITGFATRVTFSDAFIKALVAGCMAAGLQMRADLAGVGIETQDRAGFAGIAAALANPNSTGLFNQQTAGTFGSTVSNNMFQRFGGY